MAIGLLSADKISHRGQAYMHVHITDPARRRSGLGSECVRATADIYFKLLALERLFCQPNAFNVAPNRTLQRAGFAALAVALAAREPATTGPPNSTPVRRRHVTIRE